MKAFFRLLIAGLRVILPKRLEKVTSWIELCLMVLSITLCLMFEIKVNDTVCNLALPALSIFTALVFTAIFTVPSQLSDKLKDVNNNVDEPTLNYLIRYRNFINSFSKQLISMTIISFVLIVLIIFVNVIVEHTTIITGLIIPFSLNLIMLIIATVINISRMIEDNIKYSTTTIERIKNNLK